MVFSLDSGPAGSLGLQKEIAGCFEDWARVRERVVGPLPLLSSVAGDLQAGF